MSLSDKQKEKLDAAYKMSQRKVNTLGPDCSANEEPFGFSTIIVRDDIFSETPTASTNFPSPEYGDAPGGGAVATRHVNLRLHPLAPSGLSGPDSIQTFVVVRETPSSDNPDDIEEVRIKHLVPPQFSPGRSDAADTDPNFRGFELALYPAYDNGGQLDAYTDSGPIPITADPTAEHGIGDTHHWLVDYANGIVRLTGAPISGEESVFNPNNVFGDISGNTDANGRLTLFATFYQYTGPTLTDADDVGVVTVGDGTISFGNYYGPTSTIMQMAIDSLGSNGGTVLVKEGNYTYTDTVHVPPNVRVVGLSHNARITKPENSAAFRVFVNTANPTDTSQENGANIAIKGLTILGVPTVGSRGMIRLNVNNTDALLENIDISDNRFFVATEAESAIELDPVSTLNSVAVYKNILVGNNIFRATSYTGRVNYITEQLYSGANGQVRLEDFVVKGNDFGEQDGYAVDFFSERVSEISGLVLSDNNMGNNIDFRFATNVTIDKSEVRNNKGAGSFEAYRMTDSLFDDATIDKLFIRGGGLEGCKFINSRFGDVSLDGYLQDNVMQGIEATRLDVLGSADNLQVHNSLFSGAVNLQCNNGDNSGETLTNLHLSGNRFLDEVYLLSNVTNSGNYASNNVLLDGNSFELGLHLGVFFGDTMSSTSSVRFKNLRVSNNTFNETDNGRSITTGTEDDPVAVELENVQFTHNRIKGNFVVEYQSGASVTHLDVLNNLFSNDSGFYLNLSESVYGLRVEGNKVYSLELLDDSNDISLDVVVRDVSVSKNTIFDGGYIQFRPVASVSGSLTFESVNVLDNLFEGVGHIGVLDSSVGGQNYVLDGLTVSKNILRTSGSYINIFGKGQLGASASTYQLNVDSNETEILFVGGGAITDGSVTNNKVSQSLRIDPASFNLVFNNNSAPYVEFNNNLSQGMLSNNNVFAFGMIMNSDLENTVMSDNNIDGYLDFNSDFTNSTLNGNNITGNLSFATTNNSSMSNNTVGGSWSNTTWSRSTAVSNTVGSTMTVTNLTDSVIGDSAIDGNLSLGNLTGSKVVNNTLELTLTAGSLTDSEISHNDAGNFTISGAVATSHFDTNICRGNVQFDSTVTSSTVNGNVSEILDFNGAVSSSSISDNSVVTASGTQAVDFASTVTASTIIGNVFEAASATTTFGFGNFADVVFAENRLLAASLGFTFGTLTDSSIVDCVFDTAGAGTCEVDQLADSKISGCRFVGDFTITSTSTDDTVLNSAVSKNIVEGNLTVTSGATTPNAALNESILVENNITGNLDVNLTDDTDGNLALLKSVLSNNFVSGNIDIDYSTGTGDPGPTTLVSDSVIQANEVSGDILLGQNMEDIDTSPASFVDDTLISDNRVEGAITLAPSSRDDTVSTHSKVVITGNVTNQMSVYGALNGCVINSNTVFDTTSRFGGLVGTALNSNMFGESASAILTLASGFSQGATVNDNIVSGTLNINGSMEASTFIGNTISDAFSTNNSMDDVIFADNSFMSSVQFEGAALLESTIKGNKATSMTFGVLGSLTDINISDNIIDTNLGFSGSSVQETVIANNNIDGFITLGSSTQNDIVISGNNTDGVTLSEAAQDVNIVGNNIQSTLQLDALTNTNITSNVISGAVTFNSTITRVNFTNNTCASTLSLPNSGGTDFALSNNVILGAVTCSAGGTYDRNVWTGNRIDDIFTFSSVFDNSLFNSNVITGAVLFNATAPINGGSVQNSILDGNVFEGNVTFNLPGTVGGVETPFFESAFTNNKVVGTLLFDTNYDHAIIKSVVSGNHVGALTVETVDLSCMLNSVMDNNIVEGNMSFVHSTTNQNILSNSSVCNNYIGSSLSVAITNLSGFVTDNTTICDNVIIGSLNMSGSGRPNDNEAYRDSVISGNSINGSCNIHGELNDSVFSDNQIDGTFETGNVVGAKLSDNLIGGAALFGSISESGLTNNDFKSNATFSSMTEARFSNNKVGGFFSTGSSALTDCSLIGNIFDGAFTSGGWTDVTCSNNNFLSTLTSSTGSNPAINKVVFNGNVCEGAVLFDKTSPGGTNNFYNSSFTGNLVNTSLTIGGSAANEFESLNFTGNTGLGSLTLATQSSSSELDGIVIVANTMTGGLTLTSGPFTVPSSGHGGGVESELIIALNSFTLYTGINFTNHAIGWANQSSGNTGTTVGSNY